MTPQFLALGAIWYVVFLFSTTCHEAAHSLVAHLGGDDTAFRGGQGSLNPIPHILRAPIGIVVVPILSYLTTHWMIGWANAPYDPLWQRRYPRRAAWMALAGPAANFTLVLIAGIAIRVGLKLGVFQIPDTFSFAHIIEAANPGNAALAATFLSILFVLNVLLGTFNLLPVPPLDGNTVVTLLMPEAMALRFLDWSRANIFGMAGILLAWVLYDRMFGFIFGFFLGALYPGIRLG